MYISIDLGGTNTRVASSRNLEDIYKVEKFPTNIDLKEQQALLNKAVGSVIDGEAVDYICIGVPGLVDRFSRKFEKIVNYPALNGLRYEQLLDVASGSANIIVENDSALAGLAESRVGDAANSRVVAYLTLSTGVGGVRVQNKRLSRAQGSMEPGHMIIVEDGAEDDVCGQKGCLHAYLSGAMFEKVYGEKPEDTKDASIWDKYGKHLATGITNIVAMWDPDIVVIGGSLSKKFDVFSDSMMKSLKNQDLFDVPNIVRSTLGDENGLLGGFHLISQITN